MCVERLHGNLEQLRYLVDKCARAAGADAVHTHVGSDQLLRGFVEVEEDDLGILPAEFDGGACLRVQVPDRDRVGDHFLYEVDTELAGDGTGAAATNRDLELGFGEFSCDEFEKLADAVGLLGEVATVFGEPETFVCIDQSDLRSGRPDIDTQ